MILAISYLVLLLGGFGCLMYFTGLYSQWYWYWIPLIGIPLGYVLLFGITLFFLFPFAKMVNVDKEVKRNSKIAGFFVRQMDYLTCQLALARVKFTGFKKLNKHREYLFIYNHVSNFDPMLLMYKVRRLICITKYGNKKIPIVGGMIHKAGYITVDREHDQEGIKAINKAIDTLNEHKASIAVAPEGTRSKTLELLPFHAGTFNIAKRSGVPIVCVGIKNTNMIHKNFPKKFTKINCDIIYIMEPDEYMDLSTVEIANRLHKIYEEYLQA